MENDSGMVRPHYAWNLGYGEHLLVWTLRRIVFRRAVCPVVARAFADACGEDGAETETTKIHLVEFLPNEALCRLPPRGAHARNRAADEPQMVMPRR